MLSRAALLDTDCTVLKMLMTKQMDDDTSIVTDAIINGKSRVVPHNYAYGNIHYSAVTEKWTK